MAIKTSNKDNRMDLSIQQKITGGGGGVEGRMDPTAFKKTRKALNISQRALKYVTSIDSNWDTRNLLRFSHPD